MPTDLRARVRLFVAIEVGPPPPERSESPGAVDHVTLRFLGELPEDRVPALAAALAGVAAGFAPFDLVLEGVGAFPSPTAPRVVYVGARRGAQTAAELARQIGAALEPLVGAPPSRERFVPHWTLFRVRSRRDREAARSLLDGRVPGPPSRTVHVDRFFLKASTLTPRGAHHRTLAEFRLEAAPADGA